MKSRVSILYYKWQGNRQPDEKPVEPLEFRLDRAKRKPFETESPLEYKPRLRRSGEQPQGPFRHKPHPGTRRYCALYGLRGTPKGVCQSHFPTWGRLTSCFVQAKDVSFC